MSAPRQWNVAKKHDNAKEINSFLLLIFFVFLLIFAFLLISALKHSFFYPSHSLTLCLSLSTKFHFLSVVSLHKFKDTLCKFHSNKTMKIKKILLPASLPFYTYLFCERTNLESDKMKESKRHTSCRWSSEKRGSEAQDNRR